MNWRWLDRRPVMVAIAGPNGAGKTTFYHAHVAPAGLRLVNADRLASELELDAYAAARIADSLRRELVRQGESFAFETVFSDPVGDKLGFLQETAANGYTVLLCFIGLSTAKLSADRVAMRVSQGGHDVPLEKLRRRFPRILDNLKSAIVVLPRVVIFDNSDLARSYHRIASFEGGEAIDLATPLPKWLREVLRRTR